MKLLKFDAARRARRIFLQLHAKTSADESREN
jgi:hypothetical protein